LLWDSGLKKIPSFTTPLASEGLSAAVRGMLFQNVQNVSECFEERVRRKLWKWRDATPIVCLIAMIMFMCSGDWGGVVFIILEGVCVCFFFFNCLFVFFFVLFLFLFVFVCLLSKIT
jgi:hypothetical protein